MALSGRTTFSLRVADSFADPLSGEGTVLTTFEALLTDGTTANKANLSHKSINAIGAAANVDIDFRALEDVFGAAMASLTEVVALVLEAPAANPAVLTIKPSASNGWTAFLDDASDEINLQPGATLVLYAAGDGLYPVTASDKSINVANADAAVSSLTLTLIGRNA
jgi:hypothetical protein